MINVNEPLMEYPVEERRQSKSYLQIWHKMLFLFFPLFFYYGSMNYSIMILQYTSANFANVEDSLQVSLSNLAFNMSRNVLIGCQFSLDILGSFQVGNKNITKLIEILNSVFLFSFIVLGIAAIPFIALPFLCTYLLNYDDYVCNGIVTFSIPLFFGLVGHQWCALFSRIFMMLDMQVISSFLSLGCIIIQGGLLRLYNTHPIDLSVGFLISKMYTVLLSTNIMLGTYYLFYYEETINAFKDVWAKFKDMFSEITKIVCTNSVAFLISECLLDYSLLLLNVASFSKEDIVAFTANTAFLGISFVSLFLPIVSTTVVMIGKSRGEGNKEDIRKMQISIIIFFTIVSSLYFAACNITGSSIHISDNIQIQEAFEKSFLPCAIYTISNGLLHTFFGMLRGMGLHIYIPWLSSISIIVGLILETLVISGYIPVGNIVSYIFYIGASSSLFSAMLASTIILRMPYI